MRKLRRIVATHIEAAAKHRTFPHWVMGALGLLFIAFMVLLLAACEPQQDPKIRDSERVRYDQFRIRCVGAGGVPTGQLCLKNGKTLPIFP